MSEEKDNNESPKLEDKDKPFASNEYSHLFEDKTKLIDCPKEIVFTVVANVLSQNENGEYIGSNEICKKNYHIPIPISKDYHVFMDSFFKFLEGCLSESGRKAYQEKDTNSNE